MSQQGHSSTPTVQEFVVRVPKNVKKKYHVMRFSSNLNVDFTKWNQVKMERENNMKEFKTLEEDMPKQGAGSEFGREQREEARRKKYGIQMKRYKADDQPWILKSGGKTGKKYKGIREGGISDNAAYYVFTQAPDGAFEAFPIQEWYNFTLVQRYKALTAEEAEEEFGRRNKILNYFSVMVNKRCKQEEKEEVDEDDVKKGKGRGKKEKAKSDLKISDMDDWAESSSDEDEEEKEKSEDEDKDKKKNKKKVVIKKKKKKNASDDEAFEESDDGDEEGRELDYISDSSESDSDLEEKAKEELKGVAEEDALKKLLDSDEEDEEEEKKPVSESEEEKEKEKNGKEEEKKKKKPAKKNVKKEAGTKEVSSTDDFNSTDSDDGKQSRVKKEPNSSSSNSSRAPTPTRETSDMKRKAAGESSSGPSSKRPKFDNVASGSSGYSSYTSDSAVNEDMVRRYLARKPMTATEVLQKCKSKKTGMTTEQLVTTIAQILKRLNPTKQTIKGKMYLSLKSI